MIYDSLVFFSVSHVLIDNLINKYSNKDEFKSIPY